MTNFRNYGDERILEFEHLAEDWANAMPTPNHPTVHLRHAEKYRKKAEEFRTHHERDKYWREKEDYPTIKVGKTYEARNGGVFTIKERVKCTDPRHSEGLCS